MIKTILWDFDNTLLDFDMAEKNAITATFKLMGFGDLTSKMLKKYIKINKSYWRKIEKKQIDKETALVKRYEDFFSELGIDSKYAFEFNKKYEVALGDTIIYIDNSYEIVKSLNKNYNQYIVSNGALSVQKLRLRNSKFDTLFDKIFISDEIGAEKPNIEFFDFVFKNIKFDDKSEILIVGDSLTSDIQGGNNAGILTCWYNRKNVKAPNNYKINYNINNLTEIYEILHP